ncbi:FAD-binding domain-containing protein [Acephala macrosclerotiorum]|nr:FAD-binding domain-containing protein [Acephala macrosclerotiorum]
MKTFLAIFLTAVFSLQHHFSNASSCRCLPGDECWPPPTTWKAFNDTVGGRLIATVPLGTACHSPHYNATECAYLQSQWQLESIHMNSSSSVMAPFFANQSCDPFQPPSRPCLIGNYVEYVVNVTEADDVIAAINFAKVHNIRFVIRNTGHDYLGKSTGAGALAVWMHHLKDIEVVDWSDPRYTGKAMKMGAGVQGFDALYAGTTSGFIVLGGECPTVGLAGGYTQGGGHSALSTTFGLAADNTLEFEVVTAGGDLIKTSPTENEDLFWALSGGGGGTYGVVLSMTVKAYPDSNIGGGTLLFHANETTLENFYTAIDKFHALLPAMADAGAMVIYYFTKTFFTISPLTVYNQTADDAAEIFNNFTSYLDENEIPYTHTYTESSSYYDHFNTYFGPLPFGNIQVGIAQYGGRLISRDNIEGNSATLSAAFRNITQQGATFIGVGLNVSSSVPNNAVLPAWRTAVVSATLTLPWSFEAPWSDMIALQDEMTDSIVPQLEAATPNSGAYMNEADFRQPNSQQDFFGANYNKLLSIKKKWDPSHIFYAITAVGSEYWTVAKNGRMCKVELKK